MTYEAAGDPRRHDFWCCGRCHTWRPAAALTPAGAPQVCLDVAWCSAMAEVGKGSMDADTGIPDDAWTKGNVP